MRLSNRFVHHPNNKPSRLVNIFASLLIAMLLVSANASAIPARNFSEIRQLVQLAEYIGVDYAEAVDNGQVIDEEEYQEMREFSALLVEKSGEFEKHSGEFRSINKNANALQLAIERKQDISTIRELSTQLHASLLTLMPQSLLPEKLLPKELVTSNFQENCAMCHGISGQGNGAMAAQFEPAPTNFTDKTRAMNRSLLGLFESISEGIADTAMPAFKQLTEEERWSLAFYVGSLAFQDTKQTEQTLNSTGLSLAQMTYQTPNQLLAQLPAAQHAVIESLRAHPDRLIDAKSNPFSLARKKLKDALQAYKRQDFQTANSLTVSAYLDGFELVENSLDARDKVLRQQIEAKMMQLRQLVKQPNNDVPLDETLATTLQLLDDAERLLQDATLSGVTLFSASLIILLREGLEALLVVLALITVLLKTSRRDALKYVHFGWTAALVIGIGTWAVAQSLITISGASREIMEGVAALLAAVVLFYVGVWMHSKTHATHWQAYIQRNIDVRLKSGALWGLAALSFIAVYREVFETVLFYQALLTQAVTAQHSAVLGGFLSGVILLAMIAWLLIRYSIRLPIATFFSTTTYLLLTLSFILTGKAVMALQEAAVIGISPLPVTFAIDWIGVKSTWQGMLAQLSILVLFMVFMVRAKLQANRTVTESPPS